MKLKYFSLLFAVIGILVLYFLSELSQPPTIEIHELPDFEGKQVTVDGIVKDHHSTKYGSQIITIENNNATATVFVEAASDVEYGDKIQVTGEVQKYKDDWEIVVNDNKFIKILKKWHNISFPLWQLADNPTRYLDLNVNVTGHVEAISNAYFYLVDVEKKHSLIVFYKLSKNIAIFSGQKISASGKFSFDKENFRYQLRLYEEKHGITPLE